MSNYVKRRLDENRRFLQDKGPKGSFSVGEAIEMIEQLLEDYEADQEGEEDE